jgi:Tfp pilus assembly protein FimT
LPHPPKTDAFRRNPNPARQRGTTLLELLVYLVLFAVVVGAAVKTFSECWDNTKSLRRNADDLARALDIGERWRADVRAANGPIQTTILNGAEQLRIPAASGEIVYTFSRGELRRQAGATAPNTLWLSNVKSSRMESDLRGSVTAWRWELELKSARREPRLRPLFTFAGAAGTAATP